MRKCKTLLAILLVLSLAVGLCACSLFPEPEEKLPVQARTPLPQGDDASLAYCNHLLAGIAQAAKCTVETSYGMGDIEAGNPTLKAAAPALRNSATAWLAHKEEYNLPDEAFFLPSLTADLLRVPAVREVEAKDRNLWDDMADLGTAILVRDVLEMEIERRLVELQAAIDDKRNTNMVNEGYEARREYVLTQMGVAAKEEAEKYYQIDMSLDFAAVGELLRPGDKEAILAELAKSAEYLLVEDYTLEPRELTLYAKVDKEADRLVELRITEKAGLETSIKGVGTLASEGEAPVTLTLTKTVKYTGFGWTPVLSAFGGVVITMDEQDVKEKKAPCFHAVYGTYDTEICEAVFDLDGALLSGELPEKQAAAVKAWALERKKDLQDNWNFISKDEVVVRIRPLSEEEV